MPILNYTTQIAAEKTTTEIQRALAKAGAQAVLCEYDTGGVLIALSFRLITADGPISFRLPANIDKVLAAMKNDKKVSRAQCTKEQASRVAWRILKDWIEAQVAIVQADLAELPEVFLPYAQGKNGKTLYDQIKGGGFLQIAGPK